VDHIDRNKTNNNVSNLHWVTISENSKNVSQEVLENLKQRGLKGAKIVSKAVECRDKDNHSILYNTYPSSLQAAIELFGDKSKNSLINRCANGNKPSAYGYWWCFANKGEEL